MKRYREINQYRKSFDIVTNYVHYPVAVFLCTLLSYTAVTPNQVTALAVAVELIAAFLIFQDSSPNLLLVALLLQLGWILDLMDGLLARYKKVGFYNPEKPSIRGYYLDAVSDHVLKFILLGSLTYQFALYNDGGWILGLIAIVIHGISQTEHTLRELIQKSGVQSIPANKSNQKFVNHIPLILNNIYLFYIVFLPINRIDLFFYTFAFAEMILFTKRIFQFWKLNP